MGPDDLDSRVRNAAFLFLVEQKGLHPRDLPRDLLARGFTFEGRRVPLVGPQGIFKPAVLPEMPLSITTAPVVEGKPRPYADEFGPGDLIYYRYRGTDPQHPDNRGLHLAMKRGVALVYLFGTVPGRYAPAWPAFIVGADPGRLTFTVRIDAEDASLLLGAGVDEGTEARRAYVTAVTRRRLHQQAFRQRVLRAYHVTCAICRLRREELLEAAHILPDGHPRGAPVVPNGLALCNLHHAAFDRHIVGVRPDLTVDLRKDVLREPDGPMLRHGLQGFHGSAILVPHRSELRPNRDFLAERYELFKKAS